MNIKRRAILFAVAVMAAVATATGADLWMDYQRTKAQAEETARDLTLVVEKHVHDTVIQVQTLLGEVAKTIVQDGGPGRFHEPERLQQLASYCKSITGCALLGVTAPTGKSVAISGYPGRTEIDVSDRGFFQGAIKTGRLYIDKAIVARLPERPIIFNISMPVYSKDGKLLAVIAAGMRTEHFTSFYQLMGFTLEPTISVFKGNGDLVARNPGMAENVGKNNANGPLFKEQLPKAPEGVYESVSVLDGRVRLAAYKSVPNLDLVIFAGIERHVALRQWQARAHVTLTMVSLLALLLAAMIAFTYRSLASQIGLLADNKVLGQLAQSDGLTGIANRRRFDEVLKRDWGRHQRTGGPLSILLIDVDCFKQFNDGYGHQAGDACLRDVAAALQSCLHRKVDLVARYGGEEFAVILESDEEGAVTVGTRMRMAVEALSIPNAHSAASCFVTISVGIASTSACTTEDAAGLVALADKALYAAKVQGRNRVSVAAGQQASLKLVSAA